ncbi:pilus assembly protein [Microbulbifer marinus]|nr:PilC/PilY family type IV pilus protein [Microbulbifer marinus]
MDYGLKTILSGLLGFSATLSTCVSAEPIDIADAPLTSVGTTEANMMILLDSSASMGSARLQQAQQAAADIVGRVQNMRVGVARLNPNPVPGADADYDGALILKGISSVNDSDAREDAILKIGSVQAEGGAPLAEALLSVGRYFVQGHESETLTLHPQQASSPTAAAADVLGPEPEYGDGVSRPASDSPAIQQYCQKNFAVVLSAGIPSSDIDIVDNTHVEDYDGDCASSESDCLDFDKKPGLTYDANGGSDYLDDVAAALYGIDLRPDLSRPDGSGVKNNIISYFIGFGDDPAVENPLLSDAGTNGGGRYWQVADTASLTTALNETVDTISSVIGSQSSVAFNSTSLEAGSVIYSARYDTSDFSGRLFAHSLDPLTGRMISTPLWEAASRLASDGYGSRQIITLRGSEGVPFDEASLRGAAQNYDISVNLNRLDINGAMVSLYVGGNVVATASSVDTLTATTNDIDSDIRIVCVDCLDKSAQVQVVSATVGGVEKNVGGALAANGDSVSLGNVKTYVAATYTRQRLDLAIDATTGSEDSQWADRLGYVRGNTTKDGGTGFRRRGTIPGGSTNLLGDIVHSAPTYVGGPEYGWTFDNYQQFVNNKKDREPMVYVGANDAMLHGFRASDGKEMFSYVPSLVLNTAEQNKGLHAFTSPDYAHKYYVDLPPTVSDVRIDRDGTGAQWTTVLVGGLRGGGKGYFALNITDPNVLANAENNADDIVLWEFDGAANAADLGLGFSEAKIAKLNNGKWAAIFGNGYNSDNGVAGLFIVYIEDGVDGSWSSGDWKFISTGAGTINDRKNGLSTPRLIDVNGDGVVDRAYAGDLMGNMWAFDLCNLGGNGICSAVDDGDWGVDYKLFGTGIGEPHNAITAAPLVASNTAVPAGALPNVLVMFGTGQYLAQADLTENAGGAFYAVWDKGVANRTTDDLVERTLESAGGMRSVAKDSDGQYTSIDWTSEYGWYMSLADASGNFAGERVVASPALRNNTLFFNTIIPNPAPCASSGTGWLMSLDFRTGVPEVDLVYPVTDFNNDGRISGDDVGYVGKEYQPPACTGEGCDDGEILPGMPGQSGFIGDVRCTPGSNGGVVCDDINVGRITREGRLTWQELIAD